MRWDVIVIGAGAAGLMCAGEAARRGRRVLVLDHNDQPGRKILISGGGKCNFTNHGVASDRYVCGTPHFVTSALKRFGPRDFLDRVRAARIAWHERECGELFCDRSAQDILDMLLAACGQGRVEFRLGVKVGPVSGDGPYRVALPDGEISAPALVIATGGLSVPKIGASPFAWTLARRLGIKTVEARPGLVPLTFAEQDLAPLRSLAGIAVPAAVTAGGTRFVRPLLFTHRGLSGPAVLQASSYWHPGQDITIDWLPTHDAAQFLLARKENRPKAELKTILAELVPARLAQLLADQTGQNRRIMAETGKQALTQLAGRLKAWPLTPTGNEGWRTAEVTLGGIDTDGLSSKTMEVKSHPGLYVVGEAADVAGWLGGYNFHWAWASGWVAGNSV